MLRTLDLENKILSVDDQMRKLPPEMHALFEKPEYESVDLSSFHKEIHPDFFAQNMPKVVRKTPFRLVKLHQKASMIEEIKWSKPMRAARRTWCTAGGCTRYGHHWQNCPVKPVDQSKESTPSQKALIDFIQEQPQQDISPLGDPTLRQWLNFTKTALNKEK